MIKPHYSMPYTHAYARGYYYGRAFCGVEFEAGVSIEDEQWLETLGFRDGLEAGRRDFQELDLPDEALSHAKVD
jgi:hypothetical protein